MNYDYEYFKAEVYKFTTIDLSLYKERQMKRRIDTLIERNRIQGYEEYIKAIKKDKALFEEFVNYLTINVSEFYRNPEQWKYLEENIFTEMPQETETDYTKADKTDRKINQTYLIVDKQNQTIEKTEE